MRMSSSKLPKGRHLIGDQAVYDINVRLQGEFQPQLEVTPITKYNSDPQLVVGRQIAVNKTYICYGLKMGNIRVLNINTALRFLLKGHTTRVSDTAFFAEDVHLLASASVNGRFLVWKLSEVQDTENKPQITGNIVTAIQIVGEDDAVHPRVCWHCHKQEVLVIGMGACILRLDTTKVGKGEVYSAEEPLKCHVDKLIDGIQLVGRHEGEVTDLSMCQWMTTRLVSASTDGTIKIWEDRKAVPLVVLRPHNGHPVNSATFFTAPHLPAHIILITGGKLNQEIKLWASASDEGWLPSSEAEAWKCIQTLELKSSGESQVEEAFFNQVLTLSQSGLLLLANAKKNAIYAIHFEYGLCPAATRMDYLEEFTVTMPILSFTGTSDTVPNGEQIVRLYCVQTQAIQQYALNVAQCLPPPGNIALERSESSISREATIAESSADLEPSLSKKTEMIVGNSSTKPVMLETSSEVSLHGVRHPGNYASVETTVPGVPTSNIEARPTLRPVTCGTEISSAMLTHPPLSPQLSGRLSGFRSPSNSLETGLLPSDRGEEQQVIDFSVGNQMDTVRVDISNAPSSDEASQNNEREVMPGDIPGVLNSAVMFKHPTHLITPSEILMAASSSETTGIATGKPEAESNIQKFVNNTVDHEEVDVKIVCESGPGHAGEFGSSSELQDTAVENKEKYFCSQVSDLGMEMARECYDISDTYVVEEPQQVDESGNLRPNVSNEKVHDSKKDMSQKGMDLSMFSTSTEFPTPITRGKKQKGKNSQVSGSFSASASVFNSADSFSGAAASSSILLEETIFPQIQAMQETINELITTQKEMQKQMTLTVAVPVTKEGKRLEVALGRSMEKAVKANADALWARLQEENSKNEKIIKDRTQQVTSLVTNLVNKELPAMVEKTVRKELSTIGPAVSRAITPAFEKTISSSILECFQRGVGDKVVNQWDKSVSTKVEATIARQIQAQFQTSGKQALQDSLKSSLESTVVPAFDMSCKALFEQVDSTFQKGMVEHTNAAQQHFESTHSALAIALRDSLSSASSMTQTISGELADAQRKLLALATAGANSNAGNPLVTQLSNGPLGGLHEKVEAPLDPMKELSRLMSEHKYEEAFTAALQRSDLSIVSWLCTQVDLRSILSTVPLPLSQGVLLSLLQQLACDIHKDTPQKLSWMTDVAVAINPTDPMIAMHVRLIFEQVYQVLNHHRTLPTTTAAELASIRLVMHVINSMLMTCK